MVDARESVRYFHFVTTIAELEANMAMWCTVLMDSGQPRRHRLRASREFFGCSEQRAKNRRTPKKVVGMGSTQPQFIAHGNPHDTAKVLQV
jgi:hypothetical protein